MHGPRPTWPRRARDRPRPPGTKATNVLCCLLSRPFVIGSGRFDRNCFRWLCCCWPLEQLIQGWSTREIGEPSATSQGRRREREAKNLKTWREQMEEEYEMGRAATPLFTRAHANAATTRPIVAAEPTQHSGERAGRGSAGREQNVGQLEPSSISETGWQLKEGGRRRGRRRRTRSKEARGKEGRRKLCSC